MVVSVLLILPDKQTNKRVTVSINLPTGQLYVGHVPGTTREHTVQSDPQQSSCTGERVLRLSSVMVIKILKSPSSSHCIYCGGKVKHIQ